MRNKEFIIDFIKLVAELEMAESKFDEVIVINEMDLLVDKIKEN